MGANKLKKKLESLKDAAKQFGHTPQYKEDGPMVDVVMCSCGWESNPYYDGVEYAWNEWMKHAKPIVEEYSSKTEFKIADTVFEAA